MYRLTGIFKFVRPFFQCLDMHKIIRQFINMKRSVVKSYLRNATFWSHQRSTTILGGADHRFDQSFTGMGTILQLFGDLYEPRHDRTNKVTMCPAKTQISLGIRPVWSESSLCAQWVAKDPSLLHADSEDFDQTGRMPRLIWVFAGRTVIFLVLSWGGSYVVDVSQQKLAHLLQMQTLQWRKLQRA